jgi:hypothetical protein
MITPDKSLKIQQYTMAGELFTRGFPAGGGPCTCSAVCCEGGVYVDLRERDAVMAHRELIAPEMDETQNRDPGTWFEHEEHEDTDFPSGSCVGTQIINDKCAFLDGAGRCVLQTAAIHAGMHRWAFKPLFCVLYPIEIAGGVVSFDTMLQDEQSCCSVTTGFDVPVYQACREELVHLVGEDGYAEMNHHYTALRNPGGPS